MKKNLSEKQEDVLDFIKDYIGLHGWPPTRAEIAEGLNLSHPSAADYHLAVLEDRGWVELFKGVSRGIKVL